MLCTQTCLNKTSKARKESMLFAGSPNLAGSIFRGGLEAWGNGRNVYFSVARECGECEVVPWVTAIL